MLKSGDVLKIFGGCDKEMKRSAFLFVVLILSLEMAGCGNLSLQNNSKPQTESSQVQSSTTAEPSQSSAVPSSDNAVSSNSSVQSSASAGSAPSGDTSSQTQQEILEQMNAALHTEVPLMLPTSVPTKSGYYLTATTASQSQDYKVNLYETAQPAEINSQAASKGTLIAAVEGTEYKDAVNAKDNISGYEQVDTSNYGELLDLGHKIKAVGDAGLGHQYLIWNEGRWCLRVDSPTDPTYKNKEYPDREQLAKNVVAYLEDHMLPAPREIGVITINIWSQSYGTTVQWQDNQTVYQVSSQDPMTALKVAVAMKSD